MHQKLLKAGSCSHLPLAPKPHKTLSKASLKLDVITINAEEIKNVPNPPSHRHTRSYGRVLPTLVSKLKQTPENRSSPALTPSKALLENHEKLSRYEHSEVTQYKEIFYLGCGQKNTQSFMDSQGFYKVVIGDHLAYRYEILSTLGQGSFGTVVKCKDHKFDTICAVKIIKKSVHTYKSGLEEIEVLNKLRSDIYNESTCIVNKLEDFSFRGHLCIVFELLTSDLYNFLKSNHFQGISANLSRRITTQVLIALKHSHSLKIIHCDVKPENIVFRSENKSGIKVIDFGSTCTSESKVFEYVQSRFYRAPEVILNAGYDEKIDIWSLGCVVVEMASGWPLFPGEHEEEMIELMKGVLGNIPEFLVKRSKRTNKWKQENLKNTGEGEGIQGVLDGFDPEMIDFVKNCLDWDPRTRFSADQALMHPWIKRSKTSI